MHDLLSRIHYSSPAIVCSLEENLTLQESIMDGDRGFLRVNRVYMVPNKTDAIALLIETWSEHAATLKEMTAQRDLNTSCHCVIDPIKRFLWMWDKTEVFH